MNTTRQVPPVRQYSVRVRNEQDRCIVEVFVGTALDTTTILTKDESYVINFVNGPGGPLPLPEPKEL